MRREDLLTSFGLSLSAHLVVALCVQMALMLPRREAPVGSSSPISVELSTGGGHAGSPPAEPARAPVVERMAPAPIARRAPVPRSRPTLPRMIDGVRLATSADVHDHSERELRSARVQAAPEPAAAPIAAPPPAPESTASAPAPGAGESASGPDAAGFAGVPLTRRFRPDTPGWYGRMFGQVSVRDASGRRGFYGKIHLFTEDDVVRDYSERSLFGQSFREELGGGAVREFQTGRVKTSGAYLMVSDLFATGRLSTMSHTVLLLFPRNPPAGGSLYEVVERGSGDFRLRAPNGTWLDFDAATQGVRGVSGFDVAAPGAEGTPPRVAYRGLHVRIEAVGRNPFLRGAPATVVDRRRRECGVSTSDLFVYPGRRRESDMFRFRSDREFFSFLAERCPSLELPRPAEPPRVVVAKRAPPPRRSAGSRSGGLLGPLLDRLR